MALFGKADADINILTQFYQLEFDAENPEGSELDIWVARYHAYDEFLRDYSDSNQLASGTPFGKSLPRLAEIHPLVRRVMDFMASQDTPEDGLGDRKPKRYKDDSPSSSFAADIYDVNEVAKTLRPHLVILNPHGKLYDNNFPVSLYYTADEERWHWKSPPPEAIIKALLDALPRGRSGFRRCPTCGSVFVVGKSNQIRCSRRCNARESARKRIMQEEMAGIDAIDWDAAEAAMLARRKKKNS